MNGFPRISANAPLIVAVGAALLISVSGAAAEPFNTEKGTLAIGLPPKGADDPGPIPIDLAHPGDDGVVLRYNFGQFSVQGGKINPEVGISWDKSRSLFSPANPVPDQKPTEKVELSTGLRFHPNGLGSHRLTGGATFLDLSPLQPHSAQNPGFYDELPPDARSGSAHASGYRLMLEGGRFPIAPDLSYRLGYVDRPTSADPTKHEAGFTAGIANRFDLNAGVSLTPSIEAARMSSGSSNDHDYLSASMMTEWRNWNLTLTYGRRDGDGSAASLIDNYETGASIGYVFDSGVTADIGWERQKDAEEIADHIGFQFKYRLGFGR